MININIIGKSECTAAQMAAYLISKNPNAKSWALEYAKIYLEEGEAESVRGDGAWVQSCIETGNFTFSGGTAVTFDQNNFCGMGVTQRGMKGNSFTTPRLGIRAQIQHLKAYATTLPLINECVDPRYKYVNKGCAPRFEDLAGKWACPGYDTSKASSLQDAMAKKIGYGFDIINGIKNIKKIKKEENEMSNSSLVSYTKISPNKTSPRTHKINTITIHCIVGQWTAKQGCDYFANPQRQASANYIVGKDGSIGLCVDEGDRAWTSGGSLKVNGISGSENDQQAVTIEVASDTTPPYAITDKALSALIDLCADICRRNGIKELKWKGDKSLVGKVDQQNMTVHRWFANKACPGDYLYNLHPYIASEVNKKLGVNSSTPNPTPEPSIPIDNPINSNEVELNKVNIYSSSTAKSGSYRTGKYYIWSNEIVNGRIRITNAANRVGVAGQVTGWVNISDISIDSSNILNAVGNNADCPFIVKCLCDIDILNKPDGMVVNSKGCKKNIKYTIVKVEGQYGFLKSGAGYIKISPDNVQKLA